MTSPKTSHFSQIIRLALPFWPRIIAISTIIISTSFLRQISPQIQRLLIDLISNKINPTYLGVQFSFVSLLVFYLVVTLILVLLERLMSSVSHRFDVRFHYSLREKAYSKLLYLPITYYNKNQSGSILSKVERGASMISQSIHNLTANIIPNIAAAIISMIVVASYRWELVVYFIIGFIIYSVMRFSRFKQIEIVDEKVRKLWDKYSGHFQEAISSIRLIKSFNSEKYEFSLFKKFAKKAIYHADEEDKILNKFAIASIFLEAWMFGAFAYAFWLGYQNLFTLGEIILLVQYIQIIRQPFSSIEWTFWEIRRAQKGSHDYLKILNAQDPTYQSPDPIQVNRLNGSINFNRISFTYPEKSGQKVFEDLSFNIDPGQTLAIVGKSGAGKTTLAHLLIRFFDTNKGNITIDGHDIKDLDLNALRQNIGLVMQQSYLFGGTIEENLRYGKPNATLGEMIIACKIANAHEFVSKLSKKYQTKIGERGIKLSGGQQQRLNIARTILKNPPILILDEATSSLDSHSEMLVQEALWKLIKGRTTIIIAHRLSTIKKADKIIVLGDGNIAEQGTHEELINKKSGIYASLHHIQSGGMDKLKQYELTV